MKKEEKHEDYGEEQHVLLQDTWTFKIKSQTDFSKDQTKDFWLKQYKKIYTFNTVENFWNMWENIMGRNNNKMFYTVYSMFRDDIEPAWEDPSNKKGCSMHFITSERGEEFATNVALTCIGNMLDNEESGLNGCTFDIKPPRKYAPFGIKWKISVWLRDSKNTELVENIKKRLITQMPDMKDLITNCRIDIHE